MAECLLEIRRSGVMTERRGVEVEEDEGETSGVRLSRDLIEFEAS